MTSKTLDCVRTIGLEVYIILARLTGYPQFENRFTVARKWFPTKHADLLCFYFILWALLFQSTAPDEDESDVKKMLISKG